MIIYDIYFRKNGLSILFLRPGNTLQVLRPNWDSVTERVSLVTGVTRTLPKTVVYLEHSLPPHPSPRTLRHGYTRSNLAKLQYDNQYWESLFPVGHLKGLTLEARLQLVFSLMIYLSITTRQLLYWLFTTEIPCVTIRISHFMGFFSTESTPEAQFAPAMVFSLWRDGTRWPNAQKYIREMSIPCAHELALQDSNRVISSPLLRIRLKTLTIRELRGFLHPTKLIEIIQGLAPFTWAILHTFCASPNRARKQRKKDEDVPMAPSGEEDDWGDDPNDEAELEAGEGDPTSGPNRAWSKGYPGFSRNPVFVSLVKALFVQYTDLIWACRSFY